MSLTSAFLGLFSPPFPASKEDAATSWANALRPHMGVGGGPVGWSLANPPEEPHPYDEEFDGDLSAWNIIEPGSIVGGLDPYQAQSMGWRFDLNQLRKSWLMMQANATAGYKRHFDKPIVVPDNMLVWARLSAIRRARTMPNDDGVIGFGLCASEDLSLVGGAQNAIACSIDTDGNTGTQIQLNTWTGGTSVTVTQSLTSGAEVNSIEYWALHKIGTTYYFWVADASGQWRFVASVVYPVTMGGVFILASNATTVPVLGSAIVGIDFIRFRETATDLP